MSDEIKGAKLIARGRQEAENRRIKELAGESKEEEFTPDSFIRYWAVSPEEGLPFPPVSPVELATVAARVLSSCEGKASVACELAAKLIRAATVQIEREKSKDEKNLGLLADNEASRRMWKNLGNWIEEFYSDGTLKGKPFRVGNPYGHESLHPFPISMIELSTLAGLKASAGSKRIDTYVNDSIDAVDKANREFARMKGEAPPEPLSKEEQEQQFKARKESFRERGIFQPDFLAIAKRWPELQKVMVECRGKKKRRTNFSV